MSARERAVDRFRDRFGRAPTTLCRSPGRVNLIGEHTDYNDGFVLPMAISRELWLAFDPAETIAVVSDDLPGEVVVDPAAIGDKLDGWGAYVQGVVWSLGEVGGFDGALASAIPTGAGLSSSAALELAVARAVVRDDWDARSAARASRRAENDWVGVSSGVMDQLACALGQDGHALLIDCRSLDVTPVPLPDDLAVVVMDTGTRRELVGSAYNDRREQCAEAARRLGVEALRDADPADVDRLDDDVLVRRARHVVTENGRTREAAEAMRAGDPARLGELMAASHASLRDDFEVSGDALDTIVDLAAGATGCLGARMTGGGFAGCAVAVVRRGDVDAFVAEVEPRYREATGNQPELIATAAVGGTQLLASA